MFLQLTLVFLSLVKRRQFWFPRFPVQKRDGGIETAVLLIYTLAIALVCELILFGSCRRWCGDRLMRGAGLASQRRVVWSTWEELETNNLLSYKSQKPYNTGPLWSLFIFGGVFWFIVLSGGKRRLRNFLQFIYVHKTTTKIIDF